ncbi:MAG TPA: alpha/beta hydrolase [Acidimicrobiales bacterium]|nr:alpha/beta hydrolase [Acidimicrobiales bacterium]
MSDVRHRQIDTNGISMHIAEAGSPDPDRPPVILCHGFPELWYSWRHQLPALAAAGYHAVAPDQRGYGRTDQPEAVDDYDIHHLTDDMIGLLDELGHEKAIFVGHDWGSMVVWAMAQRFPERVHAVCGMSVPFSPRFEQSLTTVLKQVMGDRFFYILYFQEPGVADGHMNRDPREAMRRFLAAIGSEGRRSGSLATSLPAEGTTFWDWIPPVEKLPPWLSEEELDVFATEFERTGFTGGINWYRNFHRNWEINESWGTRKVEMPAGFIAGADDPVLVMARPDSMEGWVTDMRVLEVVPGAGHWVQQEKPEETNAALLRFLATL